MVKTGVSFGRNPYPSYPRTTWRCLSGPGTTKTNPQCITVRAQCPLTGQGVETVVSWSDRSISLGSIHQAYSLMPHRVRCQVPGHSQPMFWLGLANHGLNSEYLILDWLLSLRLSCPVCECAVVNYVLDAACFLFRLFGHCDLVSSSAPVTINSVSPSNLRQSIPIKVQSARAS